MKKIIYFFLILFTTFLYSQTTYDKRISQIKDDFFITMGLSPNNSDVWRNYKITDIVSYQKFVYGNSNILTQKFLANSKSANGGKLLDKFIAELKNAEKLKTKEDIKNDNYEKTDHYKYRLEIYNEYLNWVKKGEYEKTEDFNKRINQKNSDSIFKQKSYNIIADIARCFNGGCYDKFTIGNYNADEEYFIISFNSYGKYTINGKLKVPINEAQNLQDKSNIESKIELKDLVFWNNYLVPTKVSIFSNELNKEYFATFNYEYENVKSVVFSNKDISNDVTTPMTFNLIDEYNKITLKENEEKILENNKSKIVNEFNDVLLSENGRWNYGDLYFIEFGKEFNVTLIKVNKVFDNWSNKYIYKPETEIFLNYEISIDKSIKIVDDKQNVVLLMKDVNFSDNNNCINFTDKNQSKNKFCRTQERLSL